MLYAELETAWKGAAAEFNADLAGNCKRQGVVTYGTVPAELRPWEAEFLLRLYSRDEFDALCAGADRYHLFARWACQNYGAWSRVTEREVMALYARCHDAAGAFAVKIAATMGRAA